MSPTRPDRLRQYRIPTSPIRRVVTLSTSTQNMEARIVMGIRRSRFQGHSQSPPLSPTQSTVLPSARQSLRPETTGAPCDEMPKPVGPLLRQIKDVADRRRPTDVTRTGSTRPALASLVQDSGAKTARAIGGGVKARGISVIENISSGPEEIGGKIRRDRGNARDDGPIVERPTTRGGDAVTTGYPPSRNADEPELTRRQGDPEARTTQAAEGVVAGRAPDAECDPGAVFSVGLVGTKEYSARRKQRAARGYATLRQLGREARDVDTLINDKKSKAARDLVRRLGLEKQRLLTVPTAEEAPTAGPAATKALTTTPPEHSCPSRAADRNDGQQRGPASSSNGGKGGVAPGASPRLPWLPGGSGNFLEEKARREETRRVDGNNNAPTTYDPDEDPFGAQARDTVDRVLRRACLNLVNRPWRLAGVRLSTDPTMFRRRSGEAEKRKAGKALSLVSDVSAALRRMAQPARRTQPLTPHSAPCAGRDHDRHYRLIGPIHTDAKRGLHHRLVRLCAHSSGGVREYSFAQPSPPLASLRRSSVPSSRTKRFSGSEDGWVAARRVADADDDVENWGSSKNVDRPGSWGPGEGVLTQGADDRPRGSSALVPRNRVSEGERLVALLDGAWWYGDGLLSNMAATESATKIWPPDEGLSSGEEWFVDRDDGEGSDRDPSSKREHATDQDVLRGVWRWPTEDIKRVHRGDRKKQAQPQHLRRLRESPSGFVTLPRHTDQACELPGVEPSGKGDEWRQRSALKSSLPPGRAASSRARSRIMLRQRHRRIDGGSSGFAGGVGGGRGGVRSSPAQRRMSAEARHRLRKRPRWDTRFFVTTAPNAVVAGENATPVHDSIMSSPAPTALPPKRPGGQLHTAAAGGGQSAPCHGGSSYAPEISYRDAIVRKKLDELKREHTLYEIGRQAWPLSPVTHGTTATPNECTKPKTATAIVEHGSSCAADQPGPVKSPAWDDLSHEVAEEMDRGRLRSNRRAMDGRVTIASRGEEGEKREAFERGERAAGGRAETVISELCTVWIDRSNPSLRVKKSPAAPSVAYKRKPATIPSRQHQSRPRCDKREAEIDRGNDPDAPVCRTLRKARVSRLLESCLQAVEPSRCRRAVLLMFSGSTGSRVSATGQSENEHDGQIGGNGGAWGDGGEGKRRGEEEEEGKAVPASHGLLLEFVWALEPMRPTLTGWNGAKLCRSHKNWGGVSALCLSKRKQEQERVAPVCWGRLGDTRSGGDNNGRKDTTSDNGDRRNETTSQPANRTLGSSNPSRPASYPRTARSTECDREEHAADRPGGVFLVLTLRFLCRLVELASASVDGDGGQPSSIDSHDGQGSEHASSRGWAARRRDAAEELCKSVNIPAPIKQCVSSTRSNGVYCVDVVENPPMTLAGFKEYADKRAPFPSSTASAGCPGFASAAGVRRGRSSGASVADAAVVGGGGGGAGSCGVEGSPENGRLEARYNRSVHGGSAGAGGVGGGVCGDGTGDKTADEGSEVARRVRMFWRSLGPNSEAPVYGADTLGTLFAEEDDDSWNVGRLDTILQLLKANLPGITSPMLYAGMWRSMFAFHVEDVNLYSINYLHRGDPKSWYCVPPDSKQRFESLAQSFFTEEFRACKDHLRHKTSMVSPLQIQKAGIAYCTAVQEAGDFMITFPAAYHGGFNHGFNLAESTNFAIDRWIEEGRGAGYCRCSPHSVRIDVDRFETLVRQHRRIAGRDSTCLNGLAEEPYCDTAAATTARGSGRRNRRAQDSGRDSEGMGALATRGGSDTVRGGSEGSGREQEDEAERGGGQEDLDEREDVQVFRCVCSNVRADRRVRLAKDGTVVEIIAPTAGSGKAGGANACWPEGEVSECRRCGVWGHAACLEYVLPPQFAYPGGAALPASGKGESTVPERKSGCSPAPSSSGCLKGGIAKRARGGRAGEKSVSATTAAVADADVADGGTRSVVADKIVADEVVGDGGDITACPAVVPLPRPICWMCMQEKAEVAAAAAAAAAIEIGGGVAAATPPRRMGKVSGGKKSSGGSIGSNGGGVVACNGPSSAERDGRSSGGKRAKKSGGAKGGGKAAGGSRPKGLPADSVASVDGRGGKREGGPLTDSGSCGLGTSLGSTGTTLDGLDSYATAAVGVLVAQKRAKVGPRLLGKEVLVSDGVAAVLTGVVTAIEAGQARVHYKGGRNVKLDEWIDVRSERFLSAAEAKHQMQLTRMAIDPSLGATASTHPSKATGKKRKAAEDTADDDSIGGGRRKRPKNGGAGGGDDGSNVGKSAGKKSDKKNASKKVEGAKSVKVKPDKMVKASTKNGGSDRRKKEKASSSDNLKPGVAGAQGLKRGGKRGSASATKRVKSDKEKTQSCPKNKVKLAKVSSNGFSEKASGAGEKGAAGNAEPSLGQATTGKKSKGSGKDSKVGKPKHGGSKARDGTEKKPKPATKTSKAKEKQIKKSAPATTVTAPAAKIKANAKGKNKMKPKKIKVPPPPVSIARPVITRKEPPQHHVISNRRAAVLERTHAKEAVEAQQDYEEAVAAAQRSRTARAQRARAERLKAASSLPCGDRPVPDAIPGSSGDATAFAAKGTAFLAGNLGGVTGAGTGFSPCGGDGPEPGQRPPVGRGERWRDLGFGGRPWGLEPLYGGGDSRAAKRGCATRLPPVMELCDAGCASGDGGKTGFSKAHLGAGVKGERGEEKGKEGERDAQEGDFEWQANEECGAPMEQGGVPAVATLGSCRAPKVLHRARVDLGEAVELGDEAAFRRWLGKLQMVQDIPVGHVEKCSRLLAVLLGTSPPDGSIRASVRALLVAETLRGGASQEVATFVRSLAALIADAATRARPAAQRAPGPPVAPPQIKTATASTVASTTAPSPCETIPPPAVPPPGLSIGDALPEVVLSSAESSSVSGLSERVAQCGGGADSGLADNGVRGWLSRSRPPAVGTAVDSISGRPQGVGDGNGAVLAAATVRVDALDSGCRQESDDRDSIDVIDPADVSIRDTQGAAAYASALVHMARSRKHQRAAARLAEEEVTRVAALAEQEAERRRKYKKVKSKRGAWAMKKQQAMMEAAQNAVPPASARLWPPTVVGDLPGSFPFSRSGDALLLHAKVMIGLKRTQRWARAWLSLPEGSSWTSRSLSNHLVLPIAAPQAPVSAAVVTSAVALATTPTALAAAQQPTVPVSDLKANATVVAAAPSPTPAPAPEPAPATLAWPVAAAAADMAEPASSAENAPLSHPSQPAAVAAAAAAAAPFAAVAALSASPNTPVTTLLQPSTPSLFVPSTTFSFPPLPPAVDLNDGVSSIPAQGVVSHTWPTGAAAAAAAAAFAATWAVPAAPQVAHTTAMVQDLYPLLSMAATNGALSVTDAALGVLPSPIVASCGGSVVGGVAGLPAVGGTVMASPSTDAGVAMWNGGLGGTSGQWQEEEEEDEDEIIVVDV